MLQNSPWDQGEAVTLAEIIPFPLLHPASSMPLLASPGSFSWEFLLNSWALGLLLRRMGYGRFPFTHKTTWPVQAHPGGPEPHNQTKDLRVLRYLPTFQKFSM